MDDNIKFVELPAAFIDDWCCNANHTYVLVYIVGLRHSRNNILRPDNASIAASLNVLESDVMNAWKYWEGKGILEVNEDGVVFKPLVERTRKFMSKDKSIYTAEEIGRCIQDDPRLKSLYDSAENLMCKVLSVSEQQSLLWMYEYLGLPPEVILLIINHALRNDRCKTHYLEKTAMDWCENGIDTVLKAEAHLDRLEQIKTYHYRIKRMFGIDREFTKTERTAVDGWYTLLLPSDELIEHAYDICVEQTGKLSIKYINKVLENWHEKNITTVEQAMASKPKLPDGGRGKVKTASTKFSNFDQREYDNEQLERELLRRRIKKIEAQKADDMDGGGKNAI